MRFLPPYDRPEGSDRADASPTAPTAHITDGDAAAQFADYVFRREIAAVALDSEYRFAKPGLPIQTGGTWFDIRSQRPICVSVAVRFGDSETIETAVLDVRVPGVVAALGRILRLRAPFVFHAAKHEFFSFWALGLDPDIQDIYDTKVVAQCLHLGAHNPRSTVRSLDRPVSDRIRSERELDLAHRHAVSLVGQCAHYALGYPFSESKHEHQAEFLAFDDRRPLSPRAVAYAAADAEWTLRLYFAQQPDIVRRGLVRHLQTVEFPFIAPNARMEWRGVFVDRTRTTRLATAARGARDAAAAALKRHGVVPPHDRRAFLDAMNLAGLQSHFDGGGTIEDDELEVIEGLHPAIRELRCYRKYAQLANQDWLQGLMTASDGRLHPSHDQLGTATGRNNCTTPNVTGISRVFRPVVCAPRGRALIELDYAQIEVGVAAAEHRDADLIAAFNSRDVYVAMAKRVFGVGIDLDDDGFKRAHSDLRDAMKTMVLAVIYNIQPPTLAARLKVGLQCATEERERFLEMFPALKAGLERARADGLTKGHAVTATGLRRYVEFPVANLPWTKNFLANTPIQGSAADIFKIALVDLDAEFRGTNTWLVLPLHDAILIECDGDNVDHVARRTQEIMTHAVRSIYPVLEPRVVINRADTTCWNKDGRVSEFFEFLSANEACAESAVPAVVTGDPH